MQSVTSPIFETESSYHICLCSNLKVMAWNYELFKANADGEGVEQYFSCFSDFWAFWLPSECSRSSPLSCTCTSGGFNPHRPNRCLGHFVHHGVSWPFHLLQTGTKLCMESSTFLTVTLQCRDVAIYSPLLAITHYYHYSPTYYFHSITQQEQKTEVSNVSLKGSAALIW